MSRQKELDDNAKAIQQIKVFGKLKDLDGINAGGAQFIFLLTIL